MKENVAFLAVVVLLFLFFAGIAVAHRSMPCSAYEDTPVKDVPLRCLK